MKLRDATTEEEFWAYKWKSEIESINDFERLVAAGELSMDMELGTILSLLRFDDGPLERELFNLESEDEKEELETEVDKLHSKYGITMKSPSTFIQTVTDEEFCKFIDKWHSRQGEQKRWNPDYAPPISIQSKIEHFCRTHEPAEVINEFNIPKEVEGKDPAQYVLFPFDGWMLARYLQLSYEKESSVSQHRRTVS
ncbi:hypothetical protein KY349_00860 [Candidatus Woesearchaeota archaeon]|nr:hypothetical protein [Candidatus Woesearchaeota archaeon]